VSVSATTGGDVEPYSISSYRMCGLLLVAPYISCLARKKYFVIAVSDVKLVDGRSYLPTPLNAIGFIRFPRCYNSSQHLVDTSLFFAYSPSSRTVTTMGLTVTSLRSDPSLAKVIRCTSYASEPVAPRYASPLPIALLITRCNNSSSTSSPHYLEYGLLLRCTASHLPLLSQSGLDY
jgi:hypothetical protein